MLVRQVCFGLALLMAGGCVTTGANSLTQRFVRQGKPAVDLGGPRPDASQAKRKPAPLEHASINNVSSRMSSSISSLETVHPDLREATMRLRFAPTPGHHLEVARIYRRLKIFDTAHDYLSRSLVVNGPHPEVLDALARLWRDWGQPGQGLSYAHRAVYLDPKWATPHNTLGTVLFALGRRSEARKEFEVAVSLEPDAPWALQNLCAAYQWEGRTREAISACRKADTARRKAPRPSKESR